MSQTARRWPAVPGRGRRSSRSSACLRPITTPTRSWRVKFVLFYHSALSDWNHGNAHFLRGVVSELQARGHDTVVYEPEHAWSVANLIAAHGQEALTGARRAYPMLRSVRYAEPLDLDPILDAADVVLVHEWNAHGLVRDIGAHRARGGDYVLLFHDTHHRSVSDTAAMACGEVIRRRYVETGWAANAWTWHEAADVRVFAPRPEDPPERDLVWIGNWGDDERSAELREFLIAPARDLRLRSTVHGVRY